MWMVDSRALATAKYRSIPGPRVTCGPCRCCTGGVGVAALFERRPTLSFRLQQDHDSRPAHSRVAAALRPRRRRLVASPLPWNGRVGRQKKKRFPSSQGDCARGTKRRAATLRTVCARTGPGRAAGRACGLASAGEQAIFVCGGADAGVSRQQGHGQDGKRA